MRWLGEHVIYKARIIENNKEGKKSQGNVGQGGERNGVNYSAQSKLSNSYKSKGPLLISSDASLRNGRNESNTSFARSESRMSNDSSRSNMEMGIH